MPCFNDNITFRLMNSSILDCFTRGDYSRGVELAQENQILPSNDPYSSHVVAACLFRLGRFQDSFKLLQQLESSLSENVEYLSLYGATSRRLGYFDKAESLLSKALDIDSANISIRNNYANLLIDLRRHREASDILHSILEDNPDFNDAKVNLDRLKSLSVSENNHDLDEQTLNDLDDTTDNASSFIDPLAMAFAEEEVRLHGRMKSSNKNNPIVNSLPHSDDKSVALDKLRLAEQAILEHSPDLALNLLSESLLSIGSIAALYDCAADALVQKKAYQHAEIMYLHAALLDKPTVKQLINLFSLSLIRGDITLSEVYLQRVKALSPDHEHLPGMIAKLDSLKSKNSHFSFST